MLLAAGCPADARSSRGWMPLMEAGEARHREVALVLGRAEMTQVTTLEGQLLSGQALSVCTGDMHWQQSPPVGPSGSLAAWRDIRPERCGLCIPARAHALPWS